MRQNYSALGIALCCGLPQSAAVADTLASDWAKGFNNQVRILAGTAGEPAQSMAAVEVVMPEGWKTYWRTPGEAGGIPPDFDWSKSDNLESATVLYPAPLQLVDKAGVTFGYKNTVTFPVALKAKDAGKPIRLQLAISYGVCKDICVPAEATVSLHLPTNTEPSVEIAEALAKVPSRSARAGIDPAIIDWRLEAVGKPAVVFSVNDPSAGDLQAFAEAEGGAFVPIPKRVESSGDTSIFVIDLTDGPKPAELAGKALTVTLAGAKGQSETVLQIPKSE